MGEKSIQKKQYILEKAKNVFVSKGYKNVTMKDIVEECEISRGGLYLYFESTRELFVEVLKMESQDNDDELTVAISETDTSADILALFLKEQKKELLKRKNQLQVAVYEFFFENYEPKKDNLLRNQFNQAVSVIEKLISEGVENGEFVCTDPLGAARNIMYVLEGMKISAHTMGITEEMVNRELLYIMKGLVEPEE